ncbi:hypothetical protein B0H13DRAFT_1985409 [Mycena leptocephala]|nr:hypothetical protein B0H13DRAFT_1985409 [Mycena leptocephala]
MASQQQTSSSQSPRRTFSDRISAVGAKINRALSNDAGRASQHGYDPETESIANTVVEGGDRSTSRDRTFHSSGRGGAGNIRSTINSNALPPTSEAQEFPWPRGRERAPVARANQGTPSARSTGRGGSGNFSQSPPVADPSYSLRDSEILRAHAETERSLSYRSSGRGGIGNIVRPDVDARSRSRSIDPVASPTAIGLGMPGYSPSPPRDRQKANVNGYNVNGFDGNGHGNWNGNGT